MVSRNLQTLIMSAKILLLKEVKVMGPWGQDRHPLLAPSAHYRHASHQGGFGEKLIPLCKMVTVRSEWIPGLSLRVCMGISALEGDRTHQDAKM